MHYEISNISLVCRITPIGYVVNKMKKDTYHSLRVLDLTGNTTHTIATRIPPITALDAQFENN